MSLRLRWSGARTVRRYVLVVLGCISLLTAASLPAATAAVSSRLPVGNWEALSASGDTVTVSGWAFDPDRPTAPVEMHVYVDGGGAVVPADRTRQDVGAAFPGVGDVHGFSHSRTASTGVHSVCVYAIDADEPWRNTAMGCRSVAVGTALPVGNWEVLSAWGSTVSVSGWAMDPDQPAAPVGVHVYVDGGGVALTTGNSRPDVGAVFPGAGNAHGFSHSRTVSPGVHSVCVYAIDVDNGARNTPWGCRSIAVGAVLPLANWEVLSVSPSTVTVAGWALDPDDPTASVPVHVYVDGGGTALTADGSRPDVGTAYPGAGDAHGWSLSTSVRHGVQSVCAYAIDTADPWRNTPLGCRSVTVPATPAIGHFDDAWIGPGWFHMGDMLYISGWALDPNDPSESATFHVAIDGRVVLVTGAYQDRPDVGSAFPGVGDSHGFLEGFDVSDFGFSPGVHEVCIVALAFLPKETLNTHLGCRQVTVPAA